MKKNLLTFLALFATLVFSLTLQSQTFTLINETIMNTTSEHPAATVTDIDGDGLHDVLVGSFMGYISHWEQNAVNSTSFVFRTGVFNFINNDYKSTPTIADIDGDGLLDLIIGGTTGKLAHYEQNAFNSTSFSLVTSNFNSIDVGSSSNPTFADFNGNGLLDLVIGHDGSDLFYYEQDTVNSTSFTFITSDFVNSNIDDLSPTFTDLDGDGLFDLIEGQFTSSIRHYKQTTTNSTDFQYFNAYYLGYPCVREHPVFTDIDGNGKRDMLISGVDGISHFELDEITINSSCVTTDIADSITTTSAFLGGSITDDNGHLIIRRGVCYSSTNVLPTLFDSKETIGTSAASFSKRIHGLTEITTYYYRAFATSSLGTFYGPVQAFTTTYFDEITTTFNSIDVGGYSAPAIDDLDGDGLLDLLIGKQSGYISHYKQNSVNSTTFTLVTDGFNSIDAGNWSTPTITDLDGDGLLDLLIGEEEGNINHYKQEEFNSTSFTLVTENFNSIDVGIWSAPTVADLEGDGLLDLLIGAEDGKISHYKQDTANSTSFAFVTSTFNSIDVGGHSVPTITDLTGNGLLDLLIGEYDGEIYHYEQVSVNSISFALVTTAFNSIDVGHEAKPIFSNLDGDGKLDMLIGAYSGYINHLESGLETVNSFCVITAHPLLISETSAECGGNISDDNSHLITRRGVCYSSTNTTPTLNDLQKIMGSGLGEFSDTITGLSPDSVYYIRAFCSSSLGIWYGEVQLLRPPDKFPGTALEFDGIDDYVQISIDSPQTDYTYELFFKTADQNAPISSVRHPSLGSATDRNLYLETGNIFHRLYNTEVIGSTGQNYADDTWHHVAVVVESGVGQRIYMDGELVALGVKDSSDFDWDTSLDLGYDDGYFEGKIEEVRLWNIIRTETQIREGMYLSLAGYENELISYWQVNDGSGTVLSEIISGNDGTLKNMADSSWIGSTIPFGPGVADSQTETAGTVAFTGTNLNMYFNSQTGADITVTRIDTVPNTHPSGLETVFRKQYWVVNRSGTGTYDADLTFALSEDLTTVDEAYPSRISLYTRAGNADTGWVHLADASFVDAANDIAVFNGISEVGQFIIVRNIYPKITLLKSLDLNLITDNFSSIDLSNMSSPTFIDLDDDGLLDLIVGEFNGKLYHYEQNILNSNPFSYVTNNFNSIYVGNYSSPTFTDLDGDGLLDLIVGEVNGKLYHYEQDALNSTSFSLITNNFNSIDVGSISSPTFTDLDGDGLLDLIIGESDGNLNHYEQDDLNSNSFSYVTNNFNSINIGIYSRPTFTDLNGDGLLDLIIGEGEESNLNHYEQDDLNSNIFNFVTSSFNNIEVFWSPDPVFTDLDGDGLLDLIIGEGGGNLHHYEQIAADSIHFGSLSPGAISASQSYLIRVANLQDNLNIECPEGFKVSLSENSGFAQNLSITPDNGIVSDTVYVRFEPDTLGVYEGNITHSCVWADAQYILVSGTRSETDNFPGTALEFDGVNDYIETSLYDLSGSEITIEYWFKGENAQSAVRQQSGGDYLVSGLNGLHILSNDGGTEGGIIVGNEAEDGNWHHIAMTWKQNTPNGFKSYLDGNLVAQRTSSNNSIPDINVNVMFGSNNGISEFMKGVLEEVRIWNIARDSVQIRENMYLPVFGPMTGLISYWQFNDGSGTVLSDIISDNDGTLMNMDDSNWVESTIPFGPGVSNSQTETTGTLDFTGTGLTMNFSSQNGAEITVTRIDTVPNIIPVGPDVVFDYQYWVVNRFGSGVFNTEMTFTVNEYLTIDDENDPSRIKLYTRPGNADTNWAFLTSATTVVAATNKATFSGITGFSQFIVAKDVKVDNFPGTALEFDGTNDYVETTLDDLSGSEITIEYWFRGSSTQSALRQQSGSNYIVAGWNDFHILSNDGGSGNGLPVGIGAEDGNWHHIAMTWKQNTADGFVSYLDGEIVGKRNSNNTAISNINANVFFGSYDGSGEFTSGSLEEIRIWNIARDSIQIRESMYLPIFGPMTGLISYWQCNEGTGTVLSDIAGGSVGTLHNMDETDWIVSTIPFGSGVSNSQTETAGTVDFTETGITMNFSSQNGAEITVTRIDSIPNIIPTEPDTVFDSQYWVVNRFGTGTFDTDLTFTISEDLTAEDETNPSQIKLYTRGSNADTSWVFLTSASLVDAATNQAIFNGITGFSQFIIAREIGIETIVIELEIGYQFISTRIIPEDPNMLSICDEILDNLDFVRNTSGLMLRKIGPMWINSIGDWITTEGYIFKMTYEDGLSISGEVIDPQTPISLVEGYQFISYLPENPMNALDVFADVLDNLDFVRNTAGLMLRKIGPMWVNSIGDLNPGEGYLVKMINPDVLIYPVDGEKFTGIANIKPEHFNFDGGNAADPVYTIYFEGLEMGDEVAAYDGELIVGNMKINSSNTLENDLPIFSTINNGQGYTPGKPIILKVWDNKIKQEVTVSYKFKDPYGTAHTENYFPTNDGEYSILKITKNIENENNISNINIYPNPSDGIFNISIERVSGDLQCKVIDLTGNEYRIFEFTGIHTDNKLKGFTVKQLDLSGLPAGVYFISFTGRNLSKVEKIVIQ
jgi:uncharacterized protein (DUF2141 family)